MQTVTRTTPCTRGNVLLLIDAIERRCDFIPTLPLSETSTQVLATYTAMDEMLAHLKVLAALTHEHATRNHYNGCPLDPADEAMFLWLIELQPRIVALALKLGALADDTTRRVHQHFGN